MNLENDVSPIKPEKAMKFDNEDYYDKFNDVSTEENKEETEEGNNCVIIVHYIQLQLFQCRSQ